MEYLETVVKEDLQELAKKYKLLADNNYISALRANSSSDFDYYTKEYNFYHKLSEIYRMMSLDVEKLCKKV